MRSRALSHTVAYLILVIAVFIGELILASAYFAFASSVKHGLESVAYKFGVGGVDGLYYEFPYVTKYCEGIGLKKCYYSMVEGLRISLSNTGPKTVDVVLLGVFPEAPHNRLVLDIYATMGFEWDTPDKNPPKCVEIVENPEWFPEAYFALRLKPKCQVKFTVPSPWGYPSDLFACSPMGCVRLKGVAGAEIFGVEGEPKEWIIWGGQVGGTVQTPPPETEIRLEQYVSYVAYSESGPRFKCLSADNKLCGEITWCCEKSCHGAVSQTYFGTCGPIFSLQISPKSRCRVSEGSIINYGSKVGAPATVVIGYYTDDNRYSAYGVYDSGFWFRPDKEIYLKNKYGKTVKYSLFPFEAVGTSASGAIPQDWFEPVNVECNNRVVEITYTLKPVNPNNPAQEIPFTQLWRNSPYIYIYVAARGDSDTVDVLGPINVPIIISHRQNVRIEVERTYKSKTGDTKKYTFSLETLHAQKTNKDSPWKIDMRKKIGPETYELYEIQVHIIYTRFGFGRGLEALMKPPPWGFPPCFYKLAWITPPYCGPKWEYSRTWVNLAYMLQLIPEEYLT